MNTAVDGILGFDTNDILMPHPTEKGWYKMYGRADDQIMHNTGEKVGTNLFVISMFLAIHHFPLAQ